MRSAVDPRARSESMAVRMSKQPLSEGFDLWDRGYVLGAMRLFTFKAENSPPFQLGFCLDAMGHLLARIEEFADAKENFGFAAEKYDLIQQPILAKVMTAKGVEVTEGPEAALALVNELVASADGNGESKAAPDAKRKAPFGRLYGYRAELYLQLGQIEAGIADGLYAVSLGYDRVHTVMWTLGALYETQGNIPEAINWFQQCVTKCPNYVNAYEPLAEHLKASGKSEEALAVLSRGIEVHPRTAFIRLKAYILSEADRLGEALAFLDNYLAHPPHEETESLVTVSGAAVCTLLKAKAAVLADVDKLEEAKACATQALNSNPDDGEAQAMLERINQELGK